MSSQPDGLLQTNQSYNFENNKLGNYKNSTIDSSKFANWQKDHMYKSSYAHFHSKVTMHSILGFNWPKSVIYS